MIKLVDRNVIPRAGCIIRGTAILRLIKYGKKKRLRLDIKRNTNMWGNQSLKTLIYFSEEETLDILKRIKTEDDFYGFIDKLYSMYKPLRIYLCKNDWINGFTEHPDYISTIANHVNNYNEK